MGEAVLRMREVSRRLGLSQASIYNFIKRGEFPRGLALGGRSVGWRESTLDAWIREREASQQGDQQRAARRFGKRRGLSVEGQDTRQCRHRSRAS